MRCLFAAVALLLVISVGSAAENETSVTIEKATPPAVVADAVKEVLGAEAFVVRSGKDTITLRIWPRAKIPARASAEQVKNGLTYQEIPATTVVGVVEFPNTFVDFRKQEIPGGVYTLRFALQPETGDHMGVTPYREFVLLSPAEKDTSLELLEPKALIERSAGVIKGDHPAVMMLVPDRNAAKEPALADRGNGVKLLRFPAKLTAAGGTATLGFAVTVGGHVKE